MKEILETYKLPELKKMIRATNITGYSKLKKDELIKLMIRPEHIERFKSIKPKSARVGGTTPKPISKVLRELKKLYPAYKKYIEFYEKTGFQKPKDLPAPPKWLLEGKPPPPKFKIPKIIITEIEEPKKKKILIRKKKSPVKKEVKSKLPLQVQKNKELFDLLKDKPVRVATAIYRLAVDLVDRLQDPDPNKQLNARIELGDQDIVIQEAVSLIDPPIFYKSITEGDDKTGKKIIFIEEREKRLEKEKRDAAKKKRAEAKK